MPSDKDIIAFEKDLGEARDWARGLTDEKFAALDLSTQLEVAKQDLKFARESITQLTAQLKNLPKPPTIPKEHKSWISTSLLSELKYRFRGRRGDQEKVYDLVPGTLTDSGW